MAHRQQFTQQSVVRFLQAVEASLVQTSQVLAAASSVEYEPWVFITTTRKGLSATT